jgi:hypothetical protein
MKIFNGKGELQIFNLLILNEYHYDGRNHINGTEPCKCSYCTDWGKGKVHYGLNIPKIKSGWWVIKYAPKRYLRITYHKPLKVTPIEYVAGDFSAPGCDTGTGPTRGPVLQS